MAGLSLRELEERERWVFSIDMLLAICASELGFADPSDAIALVDLTKVERSEIDLRAAARQRAREDLTAFFRKAS